MTYPFSAVYITNNPIYELPLQCAYSAEEANKKYVNIFICYVGAS